MSPEYAINGIFLTKLNVFSFGVLVVEIISGRRNREFHHHDHNLNLLGHVSLYSKFLLCILIHSSSFPHAARFDDKVSLDNAVHEAATAMKRSRPASRPASRM